MPLWDSGMETIDEIDYDDTVTSQFSNSVDMGFYKPGIFRVEISPESSLIEIPCGVSNPSSEVFIYEMTGYVKLDLGTHFDPKNGFKIPREKLLPGNYSCTSGDSHFKFDLRFLKGTKSIAIDHYPEDKVFRCHNNGEIDNVVSYSIIPCISPADCHFALERARNSVKVPMKILSPGEHVQILYSLERKCVFNERLTSLRRPFTTSGLFLCSYSDGPQDFKYEYFLVNKTTGQLEIIESGEWNPSAARLHIIPSRPLKNGSRTFLCYGKQFFITESIIWVTTHPEKGIKTHIGYEWADRIYGNIYNELLL
ncbi:unnamed protein product, partial [Allacma fusca]